MKKAVFTINLGGYDEIKSVPKWDGWDSILISDNPDYRFDVNIQLAKTDNPELLSRWYKWNSHIWGKEYKQVIYYDANLEWIKKPEIELFRIIHSDRKNVMQEISALIRQNHRWTKESLVKQWNWMRSQGFDDNQGLYLNGLFGRLHEPEENRLCEKVYEICEQWTNRDMIALPFVLWRDKIKLKNLVKRNFFGEHVKRPPHKGVHKLLNLQTNEI